MLFHVTGTSCQLASFCVAAHPEPSLDCMNALSLGLGLFATHEGVVTLRRHLLNHLAVHDSQLLPSRAHRAHLQQSQGPDLHPRDQLGAAGHWHRSHPGLHADSANHLPCQHCPAGKRLWCLPSFRFFCSFHRGHKKNIGSLCFPLMLSISAVAWLCCNKGCLGFSLFHFTSRTG